MMDNTKSVQIFDIEIVYDDGTKENIPHIKSIQFSAMFPNEVYLSDVLEIGRIKDLHTNIEKIIISNIRKITVHG